MTSPLPQVWTPSAEETGHGGLAIPAECIFFTAPPEGIGKVLSAWSTLRPGQRPWTPLERAIGVGIFPTVFIVLAIVTFCRTTEFTPRWFAGLGCFGLLAAYLTGGVWFLSQLHFSPVCTFVGDRGIAWIQYRRGQVRREVVCWETGMHLYRKVTRKFGMIRDEITFDYKWQRDAQKLLVIWGMCKERKNGPPDLKGEDRGYWFCLDAERSWTRFLLKAHEETLARGERLTFQKFRSAKYIAFEGRQLIVARRGEELRETIENLDIIPDGLAGWFQIKSRDTGRGWFFVKGHTFGFDAIPDVLFFLLWVIRLRSGDARLYASLEEAITALGPAAAAAPTQGNRPPPATT
jgi:hypothetical protein